MDQNSDEARLFSTVVIWIAAAVMFIFGFTKLSATGYAIPLWGIIGISLAIGPTIATVAIWKSDSNNKKPSDEDKH